jgi:hypothetical protein
MAQLRTNGSTLTIEADCEMPIEATFQPKVTHAAAGELQRRVTEMPYAIANVSCDNGPVENHVRIGWIRSTPPGVGVPPMPPAICNAIHAAIGKRVRALPVAPDQPRALRRDL